MKGNNTIFYFSIDICKAFKNTQMLTPGFAHECPTITSRICNIILNWTYEVKLTNSISGVISGFNRMLEIQNATCAAGNTNGICFIELIGSLAMFICSKIMINT